MSSKGGNRAIDDGIKIQALTFISMGLTLGDISQKIGANQSTVSRWAAKAKERGWGGTANEPILLKYVVDGNRSGRPKVYSDSTDETLRELLAQDRNGRPLSLEKLAAELGISASTIGRRLKEMGFRKEKPSKRPMPQRPMLPPPAV